MRAGSYAIKTSLIPTGASVFEIPKYFVQPVLSLTPPRIALTFNHSFSSTPQNIVTLLVAFAVLIYIDTFLA